MPTQQTVAVNGGTIDVSIPDPIKGDQGDQGIQGVPGPNGLPGTSAQLPDVLQGAATSITLDLQNKPYGKGTVQITGPCTVLFANAAPGGDYVFYFRTVSKTPNITWDPMLRGANGARPVLTPSPDGSQQKTTRVSLSADLTSPGAQRFVAFTDAAIG